MGAVSKMNQAVDGQLFWPIKKIKNHSFLTLEAGAFYFHLQIEMVRFQNKLF